MAVQEAQPNLCEELTIRTGGHPIGQAALAEIKTRIHYRLLEMETVLPRLWISQTPNLVIGYHKGGRFNDIRRLAVKEEIASWEGKNALTLRKLQSLMTLIISTVQNTASQKCCVRGTLDGKLQIWEHGEGYRNALPDDLVDMLTAQSQEATTAEAAITPAAKNVAEDGIGN